VVAVASNGSVHLSGNGPTLSGMPEEAVYNIMEFVDPPSALNLAVDCRAFTPVSHSFVKNTTSTIARECLGRGSDCWNTGVGLLYNSITQHFGRRCLGERWVKDLQSINIANWTIFDKALPDKR
jgi:hypothetical protein